MKQPIFGQIQKQGNTKEKCKVIEKGVFSPHSDTMARGSRLFSSSMFDFFILYNDCWRTEITVSSCPRDSQISPFFLFFTEPPLNINQLVYTLRCVGYLAYTLKPINEPFKEFKKLQLLWLIIKS